MSFPRLEKFMGAAQAQHHWNLVNRIVRDRVRPDQRPYLDWSIECELLCCPTVGEQLALPTGRDLEVLVLEHVNRVPSDPTSHFRARAVGLFNKTQAARIRAFQQAEEGTGDRARLIYLVDQLALAVGRYLELKELPWKQEAVLLEKAQPYFEELGV